ncbi:MAG: M14 family metallopeptidase [Acidobacteriota bacterium]|jgi:hypothetical protein|nr:M14 family metallopeptidase [Acidobacteriota bacterium]
MVSKLSKLSMLSKLGAIVLLSLTAAAVRAQQPGLESLQTRAERTRFVETSRYDDAVGFLAAVDAASPLVHLTTFGYSFEGRALPLAVVGKVPAPTAEAVRASGKLRVYIQANVHAGEVEGKEATLALVRDVARGSHAEWLDSMVLLVAPVFNADGNERVNLTNRERENGPVAGAGTRNNAQGLNINRDYIKLETPEARSQAMLLNDFDPHVMLDLHATNGSYHAYHLTYETPNNPAAYTGIVELARRQWLPAVADAVRAETGWELRAYGNTGGPGGFGGPPPDRADTGDWDGPPPGGAGGGQATERRWTTVEDLPRYSHNYWGLRNRFGILGETYSYLPFAERVAVCSRFVEAVLDYAHANAAALQRLTAEADAKNLVGQRLSLRSRPKRSDEQVEILMGEVEPEVNPYSGRVMLRRKDVRKPELMWAYETFESTEQERVPSAYYVPAGLAQVVERLRAHGVRLERVSGERKLPLERFAVETTALAEREFEKHRERTATGRYEAVEATVADGAWRVDMRQPLARLAFHLLEPRSGDSLLAWNFLDGALKDGAEYPILRTRD